MTRLFVDFETFSEADLRKCGLDRYSRDPSTEALMLAFAFDSEAVQQWVPAEGQKMPRDLKDALRDSAIIKSAWNAQFEKHIFKNVLDMGIPHTQWRCSMVLALTLSFPGALDKVGNIIGLPNDKKKDGRGKSLIRLFCTPQKITKKRGYSRVTHFTEPDKWEEFKHYNRQDIEAERAIWRRLRKWDLPDDEWAFWHLDQTINQRGIPINEAVVNNALRVAEHARAIRYEEMRRLTGLENPRSVVSLLTWLRQHGYRFHDLKAGHVKREIESMEGQEGFLSSEEKNVLRVLQLRSEVAKTSVDKYAALDRAMDRDSGVIRNCFQFAGAGRTWRFAGRLYQAQNLAKPPPAWEKPEKLIEVVTDLERMPPVEIERKYKAPLGPMEVLSACVRPVVQAPKGMVFVDADLNAIENRVLGWLANDEKILDVFHKDRDPYIDFATYMFERPYEELFAEFKAGDKSKRTTAKPGVLGCGYMLGAGGEFENEDTGEIEATGLLGYAWNMGIRQFTLEQSKLSVEVWRKTYERTVEFWYEIEDAMKACIRTGKETDCGVIGFDRSGPFLRMHLPSGRALHYCRPRIEKRMMPWGKEKWVIVYQGLNDRNQWTEIQTHPGKVTENADQAISRDVLKHGMENAEREGLRLRLHVHDQLAALVGENQAQRKLKLLIECMSDRPPWAKTLPLKASGTINRYFMKD